MKILTAVSVLSLSLSLACAPPPEPMAVVEATIAEVQDAIRDGRTTCRMVVQSYLDRIAAYDEPTGLHAITVVNPEALTRADEIDAALARGDEMGSLFCAPMLVKDNFDTHDLATTGGSSALLGQLPPDDAFMVRRIREEGAIVVAKTNMAEWAFSPRQTISSSFGTTANAYSLDHVPAGSSGGTASGVAASFGVAGLGSDTGNSIRGPASHLSLVGIRSTIGLTSRDGVIPLAFDRDIAGPLTRTVEDAARVFNVVAGYDPADPYTEDGRGHKEDDYTAFLDADGLQGKRIGVFRALVDTEDADTAVIARFEAALNDLLAAGAEIIDPFALENFQTHLDAPNFCARFRYDMYVYLQTRGADVPIHDVAEVLESGQFAPESEAGLRFFAAGPLDVHPRDRDPACPDFFEHPTRQAFRADLVAAMDAAELDAIAYPSWTNPPAPLDRGREEYRGDNSQVIAPATGLPAITVPMGFTYGDLPAGLQLLGRPYSEGLLFQLAYAYEQATAHRHPPAGFGELDPS